jgi:hypothetical protein
MTLDEYRTQVIERLKGCRDSLDVRGLLSEVHLFITESRISDHAQSTFWEALSHDLNVVAQESTHLMGKKAATALSALIAAAQTAIARHRARQAC